MAMPLSAAGAAVKDEAAVAAAIAQQQSPIVRSQCWNGCQGRGHDCCGDRQPVSLAILLAAAGVLLGSAIRAGGNEPLAVSQHS